MSSCKDFDREATKLFIISFSNLALFLALYCAPARAILLFV